MSVENYDMDESQVLSGMGLFESIDNSLKLQIWYRKQEMILHILPHKNNPKLVDRTLNIKYQWAII